MPRDAAAPPLYTNAWAVEVEGGEKVVDELAAKYCFINKGQVLAVISCKPYIKLRVN